jgi:hypothetical protein
MCDEKSLKNMETTDIIPSDNVIHVSSLLLFDKFLLIF